MITISKKIDLSGQKFGNLTVLNEDGHIKRGNQNCVAWLCECVCGNKIRVTTSGLKSGNTKSCGCMVNEVAAQRRSDLSGRRFGKLVVERMADKKLNGRIAWVCKCDCGNETVVTATNLVSGATKSCGCIRKENTAALRKAHGNSKTRLYHVWLGMRDRCTNPQHISYPFYGGRGIKICSEWDSFSCFKEWAMANGYDCYAKRGKCTIDRINVDGNYEPSNCRWVSMAEQNQNRRTNVKSNI